MSLVSKKNIIPATQLMGEVEIADPITGEVLPVTLIRKNVDKDKGFHKIWLQDILQVLDSFGNKKVKVLTYLLQKMRNEDNSVTITQTKISKDTGISRPTISLTLNELIDGDVLRKDDDIPHLYRFNPSMIIQGGANKRRALMTVYDFGDDNQSMTVEEQTKAIENISSKIEKKEEIIDVLEESPLVTKKVTKKISLMGMLNGKIGDIDAKEIRKKVIAKQIKKAEK